MAQMKKCVKCGEVKPLDQFHRAPRNTDGHVCACKKCSREYHLARRARRSPCSVKGCELPRQAKGLCQKHYLRLVKYGRVDAVTYKDPQEIHIEGAVARMVVRNKKGVNCAEIIIDAEDVPKVSDHRWSYAKGRSVRGRRKGERPLSLARLLMNPSADRLVIHLNGDPLDNRKVNLRIVSPAEEIINARPAEKNRSGVRGVSWNRATGRWEVKLSRGGEVHWGGGHKSLDKAIAVRRWLERRHFGDLFRAHEPGEAGVADNAPSLECFKERKDPDVPDGFKRCPQCGQVKPFSDYGRSAKTRLGITSWCKACAEARAKKRKSSIAGCAVPGCRRTHFSRGLCHRHYHAKRDGVAKPLRSPFDLNEIRIDGAVAHIALYSKKGKKVGEALIDAEDVPKVEKCKWSGSQVSYPTTDANVFVKTYPGVLPHGKSTQSTLRLGHVIMGGPRRGRTLVSVNKNPNDCRKSNLLFVRPVEKTFNSRTAKKNPSGVRGVNWIKKTGQWAARLVRGGQFFNGGYYDDLDEAIAARRKLERLYCSDLNMYYVNAQSGSEAEPGQDGSKRHERPRR